MILGKIDNSYFHIYIGTLEERGNFVSYDFGGIKRASTKFI